MKGVYFLLVLLLAGGGLHAQYVYTINADSVKITNHCDTAELILENHTQDVPGFLFNKGRGRTEFRRALQKINDSLYILGADTLTIRIPVIKALSGVSKTGDTIRLGQNIGQPGNPAALLSKREIPLNGYAVNFRGTATNTYIDSTGAVLIGATANDNSGAVLQVTGSTNVVAGNITVTENNNLSRGFSLMGTRDGFMCYYGQNTLNTASAGVGLLLNNNAGHAGYIYTGAALNGYIPGGMAIVSNGGPAGMAIVSQPGPITFNGSVNPPYTAGEYARFTNAGLLGLGLKTPSAILHIKAGTAAAGTAPIKLTTGAVLATPEDGAIEYDGTDLYLTQSSTRYKLSKMLTGQLTTSFGGASVTAGNTVTATISVPGAQPGDVVAVSANSGAVNPPSIIITAYITTTDAVTLQAYNSSGSTVALASDTYKVRVIR